MNARIAGGWLVVPYAGHDLARVHIAVGQRPDTWQPAFLDWVDGKRVAKIRPPSTAGGVRAWLRVGEVVTDMGKVVIA